MPSSIPNPFRKRKISDFGISALPRVQPRIDSCRSRPAHNEKGVPTSSGSVAHKRRRKSIEDGEAAEVDDDHPKPDRKRCESDSPSTRASDLFDRPRMPPPPRPTDSCTHLRSDISKFGLSQTLGSVSLVSGSSRSSRRSGFRSPCLTHHQRDSRSGDIITAPHHCTALEPDADPDTDSNFTQSCIATICSTA